MVLSDEIKMIASGLTDKNVQNLIGSWTINEQSHKIKMYESLLRLGDSSVIALATVMLHDFDHDKQDFSTQNN